MGQRTAGGVEPSGERVGRGGSVAGPARVAWAVLVAAAVACSSCGGEPGWRDSLDDAVVAQCTFIYVCMDAPVTPNYATWFGLTGSTLDECIANGLARNDRWEEDTDGLLEWGGCSEADAEQCLEETNAQRCPDVERSPYGPPICGEACGWASASG